MSDFLYALFKIINARIAVRKTRVDGDEIQARWWVLRKDINNKSIGPKRKETVVEINRNVEKIPKE